MTIGKQIIILIIASTILGLCRYMVLEEPYPLIKKARVLESIGISHNNISEIVNFKLPEIMKEPMMIDRKTAYYLYTRGDIVFIDSREPEDYQVGHIKNAINIPYDYYEDYESALDSIDTETILVIYCSGGECSLSIDLGDYLYFDRDFSNVLIFEGGWPEWMEGGYPIE